MSESFKPTGNPAGTEPNEPQPLEYAQESGTTITPDDHASILAEQLESEEVGHFDQELVELLRAINENPDKSSILRSLIDAGLISLKSVGSKLVGVVAGYGGAKLGFIYVKGVASEYLSNKFLLKSETIRSLPNEAVGAVHKAVENAATHVDPGMLDAAKNAFGLIKRGAGAVADKIGDLVGTNVVHAGTSAINNAKQTMNDVVGQNIDRTVDGINRTVFRPTIDAVSDLAGVTSYVPAGVIAYLIASSLTGGTAAVIREMRRENSFAGLKPLIDAVNNYDSDEASVEDHNESEAANQTDEDPRIELIATFKRISEAHDKNKYSFTKEEWLAFAAATRKARCSLLREHTHPSRITLEEQQPVLDNVERVVDGIIKTQAKAAEIAEIDRAYALEILAQYDRIISEDIMPSERRHELENRIGPKIMRYAEIFTRSGIKATGLPSLWRATKFGLKVARKAVLPI